MNNIWVMFVSANKGKTWAMMQGNSGFFRRQHIAEAKADDLTKWHCEGLTQAAKQFGYVFKAVEYHPVEGPINGTSGTGV